ncbi:MAG: FHA domain-containing protein [Anaerolineae bacterium]|nr:FHA domain-containing protein [Anaerolineae bacterium]
MRQTKEIFAEYSRMRDNGLDAKAALNVLRYHIEVLSKPDREALAGMMRTRESGAVVGSPAPAAPSTPTPSPAAPAVPAMPNPTLAPAPPISVPESSVPRPQKINSIKPLGNPTNGTLSINDSLAEPAVTVTPNVPIFSAPAPAAAESDDVVWVNCLHCGKTNQRHEVFCYSCGQLLEPVKGAFDTRVLGESLSTPLDSQHFGPDSVLVLRVRGSTENYETRPQKSDHEIIIGRSTKGSVLAPDIDLTNKQGSDLGVSRLHLSISFDAEHESVLVADLGSANGSFINGQRMMPKEVRVLRHGDELRLGKLVLLTSFRHP